MSFSLALKKIRNLGWLQWKDGRQGSGYAKFLLLTGMFPLPFDCYILKYKEGSFISLHVDKVDSGKHYRLNVVVKAPEKGGVFTCEKCIFKFWRVAFFRPDMYEHAVSKIERGSRYVFSFGFVLGQHK